MCFQDVQANHTLLQRRNEEMLMDPGRYNYNMLRTPMYLHYPRPPPPHHPHPHPPHPHPHPHPPHPHPHPHPPPPPHHHHRRYRSRRRHRRHCRDHHHCVASIMITSLFQFSFPTSLTPLFSSFKIVTGVESWAMSNVTLISKQNTHIARTVCNFMMFDDFLIPPLYIQSLPLFQNANCCPWM